MKPWLEVVDIDLVTKVAAALSDRRFVDRFSILEIFSYGLP